MINIQLLPRRLRVIIIPPIQDHIPCLQHSQAIPGSSSGQQATEKLLWYPVGIMYDSHEGTNRAGTAFCWALGPAKT